MQNIDTEFLKPGMTNVHVVVSTIGRQLGTVYSGREARIGAWWLLARLTGRSQTILMACGAVTLEERHIICLCGWIDDICAKRKPIQYVVGSVPFVDVQIAVQPPVLIPRPETEEWVACLAEQLRSIAFQTPLSILDLCTGSGCIAIALAKTLPSSSTVCAVDISPDALRLARKNATSNSVEVSCVQSDLFQKIAGQRFDLIVANPPYVTEEEWVTLDGHITHWEDRRALVAPDRGLAILKRIIAEAPNFLRSNIVLEKAGIGQVIVEIGAAQSCAVALLMKQHGYSAVVVSKDLAGRDRTVTGRAEHVVGAKKT